MGVISSKWKTGVLLAALVLIAGALLTFAYTRGPLAPPRVQLAEAAHADLASAVFGIGTIEARLSYAIGPTQAGRVLRVHVDHGERVRSGQLLAEIDPVDLESRIGAAQAALERAKASVVMAEAQLREAHSRQRVAAANAERYRELAARGFVSTEVADARQNDAQTSLAAMEAANAALHGAQSDVERSAREHEALVRQISNLKLVSPVDGIVIARDAEPGSTLVAGQSIVRLIDPSSIWVRARIDQSRAQGIQPGMPAQVVLRSNPGSAQPGRVARVEIQNDAVTEERIVAISFDAAPAAPSIGELAEATIQLAVVARALAVPSAAIKMVDGRPGVWQAIDGKAVFQPVGIGIQTLDGRTQILAGLEAGAQVIVYSDVQLTRGMKIRVDQMS